MEKKFIPKIDPIVFSKNVGWFKNNGVVYVAIPNELGIASLDRHDIDPNGGVSPELRVVDEKGEVVFHENLILRDWKQS